MKAYTLVDGFHSFDIRGVYSTLEKAIEGGRKYLEDEGVAVEVTGYRKLDITEYRVSYKITESLGAGIDIFYQDLAVNVFPFDA